MSIPYYEEDDNTWEVLEDWDWPDGEPTPGFTSGGCLPVMMLPPLAALLVSAVLILVLGKITLAAFPAPENASPAAESVPALSDEGAGEEGGLAPLFTPEVQAWAPQILEWADAWHIDPNLVATVMQIESCGDLHAVSSSGAMGLFQVMPFHFADGEDGFDPQTNAQRGLAYLQRALEARQGEVRLAFAGYNAGITGAQRPEEHWPAETARYVYWGMGIYADARQGKSGSQYLDEWLASGGAGLCAQASRRLGLTP